MGRLLKKKDKIKKKKQETDSSAQDESGGATQAATSGPGSILKGSGSKTIAKKPGFGSKAAAVKKEKNFIQKSLQFLREVKVELKKVTWPSRKTTLGSTVVVIVLVMIISLFLGVVDIGLSSLVKVVLQ